jgi:predicted aspartyl protease
VRPFARCPQDIADELRAKGALSDAEYQGEVTSIIADGSRHNEAVYLLHSVTIPGIAVSNVPCATGPAGSLPLLGQSFLRRFRAFEIDNACHVLVLR